MNRSHSHTAAIHSPVRSFYLATVFFLTLMGFGQMPIFKRYYIADIPGLGWLAEFFVTHYIHYLGAIVFLVLVSFTVIDFAVMKRRSRRLTVSGWIRCILLAVILFSGSFLVIRNFDTAQDAMAAGHGGEQEEEVDFADAEPLAVILVKMPG